MRGTVAKRIRQAVYGDQSLKQERDMRVTGTGTVFNHPTSLRARYQLAKKMFMEDR